MDAGMFARTSPSEAARCIATHSTALRMKSVVHRRCSKLAAPVVKGAHGAALRREVLYEVSEVLRVMARVQAANEQHSPRLLADPG